VGGKQFNLKEEREQHQIEEGLTHKGDHWEAQYPWIRNPNDLPDNRCAALAMLKSTEKRLSTNKMHAETYNSQIQDMVDRNVARKLSNDELQSHQGPVFYLSHHEVIKPESESTPCRIVFNSSATYQGHVLNEYWAKGPNLMNNMLGILIRFRENEVALTGDIKKMYHAVKITELDQHTHRFLWRNMCVDKEPDTYVITSVSFGDKPAGNIATTALLKTAEMKRKEFPTAADLISKNSYVDDIIDSVKTMEEAVKTTNEADKILLSGGFAIKNWIISKNPNLNDSHESEDKVSKLNDQISNTEFGQCISTKNSSKIQKVLGMQWVQSEDKFRFTVKINFSPRKRKLHTGPDVKPDEVSNHIHHMLTKRMILSQINGIYDPLGLVIPFTVKAKIMLRQLCSGDERNLGWDDDIPLELKIGWIKFFQQLFDVEKISFKRCVQPIDAVGKPTLVMFSDASEQAYGTCAYIRWRKSNGQYESRLLAAKGPSCQKD